MFGESEEKVLLECKHSKRCCCPIHCQIKKKAASLKSEKKVVTIGHFFERLSDHCIDFLCHSMRFDPAKRADSSYLLKHHWWTVHYRKTGVNVTLPELIRLSHNWTTGGGFEYPNAAQQQLDKLCDAMALVLPGCEEWFQENSGDFPLSNKGLIREIAEEIGSTEAEVSQRLTDVWKAHKPNF